MGKFESKYILTSQIGTVYTFAQDSNFLSLKISPFTFFLVQLKVKTLEKDRIKSVQILFNFLFLNLLLSYVESLKHFHIKKN